MNRLELLQSRLSGPSPRTHGQYTKISIYYQGSVAYISMRSPQDLNCLSQIMLREIAEALAVFQFDEGVHVIVFVSELNNIFCAGADIKEFHKSYFDSEYVARV